jgi:hypothetical protein
MSQVIQLARPRVEQINIEARCGTAWSGTAGEDQ